MRTLVLVIDDDEAVVKVIGHTLKREGYTVLGAHDGSSGVRLAQECRPDLVVLDVIMPDIDGWETCRRLKAALPVPVLMLTVKDREEDIVRGFQCGVHDYLPKPFSPAELTARVKAILKRSGSTAASQERLCNQSLVLDLATKTATLAGRPLRLSPSEFDLLAYFMQNPGRLLSRRELLARVWGDGTGEGKASLLRGIRRLRAKLGDDASHPTFIFNVRGHGYYFREP